MPLLCFSAMAVVVIVDLILGIHDGGLVIWSAFSVLFVLSAAQGRDSQSSQR